MNDKKKDFEILNQLYEGNYLSDLEKERAFDLLNMLMKELKYRI